MDPCQKTICPPAVPSWLRACSYLIILFN